MRSFPASASTPLPSTAPLPSAPPAEDGERIPVVDLVRFASIALVLALHLSRSQITRPSTPGMALAFFLVARNGLQGVSFFFVVSGYVITRSIVRRAPDLATVSLRDFYVRRAGRILPSVFLSIAVGALCLAALPANQVRVAYCLHDPQARYDAPFWFSLVTFWFNWLRIARRATTAGFGLHWDIFWSLAVEEQFYLLYPLALRALRRRRTVVLALAFVILFGPVARSLSSSIDPGFVMSFTNSFVCFDLLAWGALLFFVLEHLPAPHSRGRRWAEGALGLAAALGLAVVYFGTSIADADNRVWGQSAVGFFLSAFLGVGIRLGWCSSRVMRTLVYPGQLSYGAYLFHPLVFLAAWGLLGGKTEVAAFLALTGLTMGVAFLLYRGFERPLNRLVRRRYVRGLGSRRAEALS